MIHKKSLINVIFGVGIGLITGQNYTLRDNRGDYEANYEYDYNRNYMMNYGINGMNGMNVNVGPHINPLYQYLQTQQQAGYMYGDPHRRY